MEYRYNNIHTRPNAMGRAARKMAVNGIAWALDNTFLAIPYVTGKVFAIGGMIVALTNLPAAILFLAIGTLGFAVTGALIVVLAAMGNR